LTYNLLSCYNTINQ